MDALLKFITCGSVDDGKSTLIGHMLYDAKLLFADQQQALEIESRMGQRDGALDYSLLLDGLMAEREQGITIDVAYRYFTTKNRSFIVADTPGHEEYTRNMAVGASFANLAVILVDASQGVLTQTRRHARICSLMGIKHFVFAINKMDLVSYSQDRFMKIKKEIKILMAEFDYNSVSLIPVSATEGDNVTKKSGHMPWFKGDSLLTYLENIDVHDEPDSNSFIMPIQRVCRPNYTFRGFQGQIAMGNLYTGDEITVLPSGETAHVQKIYICDREVSHADTGHAVTIQLDEEIDISRGCVITKDASASVGTMFRATLLWMDDHKLVEGRYFLLKLGTAKIPATVLKIRYKIDVNTGTEVQTDIIYKNELASCEISVSTPISFDTFENNRELGSFILIDRITHATTACGTVERCMERGNNLTYHAMDITREIRENMLGQKAATIWFTGLSGSGKSTLANELEKRLAAQGKHTMLLDGDNIRLGLNKNLGFNETDRIENIRRIAETAKLMNEAGLIVLTAFISPFSDDRKRAHDIVGDPFVEVYISTPLAECEKRDVKGLYRKARNGELENFTGISSPYEAPVRPDIIVDTSAHDINTCVDMIYDVIKDKL